MRILVLCLAMMACASCSREESAADGPRPPMTFPRRSAATLQQGGTQFFDVPLSGSAPGQTLRLWLYLPPGNHAAKSLPCVLIAPAGSNLITGMKLGDGDRPEHLPYAAAGFAVVAYELDGAMSEHDSSDAAMTRAIKAFIASKGGVLNAQTAIDYVEQRVPEVDPKRLYAAGHSSAGTVALVLAANEPRVKGAVAYAPAVSIPGHLGSDATRSITRAIPKAASFLEYGSPDQHVAEFTPPVMLFTARDDDIVPSQSVADFAGALKREGKAAELLVVNNGGHFDAMIHQGIPAGIAWLKKIDKH
jgi:dipeptidyl aminopeptidase/acylaminoacyl peptidase